MMSLHLLILFWTWSAWWENIRNMKMYRFVYTAGIKYIYFLKIVYTFSFFLKSRLSGMRCIDLILNHNFCIYFHFVKSNVSSCQNLAQNHSLYCLKTHATVKFCFYFSLRQTINQKRISLGKGNHFVVFKTLKSSLGQNKLWR